jgi:hypothetical protein
VTVSYELRVRQADWDQLVAHLLPGDRDEHGAVLLCGDVQTSRGRRLLVREVSPALDGVDYIPGTRGYRHLTGEFVTRHVRRAKDLGLVYLAAHNHGGRGSVEFSTADLRSHERGYPTLVSVTGGTVGGLVLAEDAIAGDIWLPGGGRGIVAKTTIVGDQLLQLGDRNAASSPQHPHISALHTRQALVFGEIGQRILADMRVAVVGVGGVGMLVVQALSRLGVGEFIVVDPDFVTVSNLSRLPETNLRDTGRTSANVLVGYLARRLGLGQPRLKVEVAHRIARGANPGVAMQCLSDDVANDPIAKQLRDCDFIFLAADTMLARDVVNQIAYQYLIPTLQVGSKVVIDRSDGRVSDVYGVVRSLGTSPGCLRCNGVINVARLTEESLASDVQRRNQRYVDDPEVDAPSVITINAMSVGWAVNDFMQYATGIGRPSSGYRLLRSKPVGQPGQQLTVQVPDVDPDCHVCGLGAYSALSRGDGLDLPTRFSS